MHRLVTLTVAALLLLAGLTMTTSSSAAEVGTHVEVTGVGVTAYPAYDEAIARYGIRTTTATAGQVQVRVVASTGSLISVNGVPVGSGVTRTISGLTSGDEINVQVSGGGSSLSQSWIYLPDGFPQIDTVSSGEGPEPGMTALTLRAPGGDSYPALVDERGVPVYVGRHDTLTADLNRQPNGHYSLAVAQTEDLWGDYVIEEYDEAFRKVGSHRMVGHPKTDFHDTILLPGGGRILMAYIKASDGQTDSWLQEVGPDGEVLLDWNSRDHVDRVNDPILNALGDYAHLNSMQVMSDGNLLLSFRHLNQVMKIDRDTGDVIWRLGGKRSDFTFDDDPLGGPCAQHTARELATGEIQIFDNGSAPAPSPSNPLCPDPEDVNGAPVYRPYSRVTVYDLDTTTMAAHLVDSYESGAFSQFAGSAQRLGDNTLDDHVFVGLNNAAQLAPPVYEGEAPDAIEHASDGSVVWTLTAPGFATYRAAKVDAPDRIAPVVTLTHPVDGTTLQQGHGLVAGFECSDRGGANLAECTADVPNGAPLSDDVGTHQLVVRATDASGNSTTRTVSYRVTAPAAIVPPTALPDAPDAHADAMVRKPGARWKGRDAYAVEEQTITYRTRAGRTHAAHIRVRNSGGVAGRLTLNALTRGRGLIGRWYAGSRDVTTKVRAGTYRTSRVGAGRSVRLRLVVSLRADAPRGLKAVRLSARAPGTARDVVRVRLRVR